MTLDRVTLYRAGEPAGVRLRPAAEPIWPGRAVWAPGEPPAAIWPPGLPAGRDVDRVEPERDEEGALQ